MNELKIQLDNRLQALEVSPALEAKILTGVTSQMKKRRMPLRTAVILIAILCLLGGTAAAVTWRSWGSSVQNFMSWEEYQSVYPFTYERPPTWAADEERYTLVFRLSVPAYSRDLTWDQENKLFHYRNGQKDIHGGGVFTYTTLAEAQAELGINYLQSSRLMLTGDVSMRVAGSHRLYQVVADYTLQDPVQGCTMSVEAILHQQTAAEFIISMQPEQEPEMADHALPALDSDATFIKLSDTQVYYLLLADTISYNGTIRFDTPPEDLFEASLDILETLY